MWRDFFGPEARIIGIDLNPEAKKWEDFGFEIWVGDQSDAAFWQKFTDQVGEVDVVLDDGGHTYKQQITTVMGLLPSVKDGGTLIVEDTHTSYMESYGNRKLTFMHWTYAFMDEMNQRFSGFQGLNDDQVSNCVWKVSTYESISAFHVDRGKAHLPSEVANNSGSRDEAIDLRYSLDANVFSRISRALGRFAFVKNLRVVQAAHRRIVNLLRSDTAELRKLFGRLKRPGDHSYPLSPRV